MILLILIFAVMAWMQLPPLIRSKKWKDLTIFLAFYAATLTLCLLYVMDIQIPSPIEAIRHLLDDVLHIKYQ